jgi:hypothetical protein
MPATINSIACLVIKVTLTGPTPSFDVQAGVTPTDPGQLPYFCNGSKFDEDAAFFREILEKIIASYPANPISFCIEDPVILPDTRCAAPTGVPRRAPLKAAARRAAPKAAALKAAAPKAVARKAAALKAAAPKAAPKAAAPKAAPKKAAKAKTPKVEPKAKRRRKSTKKRS